jgi:hypothetical protein
MTMRKGYFSFILSATFVVAACGGSSDDKPTDEAVCPALPLLGVIVRVFDANNGAAIQSATGEVFNASYRAALRKANTPAGNELYGIEEYRPDTYQLTVQAPGFALWQKGDVVVASTTCGVTTTEIVANLVPSGTP